MSDVSSVNLEWPSNISFGNSNENLINEELTKSDAKTQTSEIDYLFKETAEQEPFTELHFKCDEDKVEFYTGLPGFDILMATFNFVSPHSTRRSPSLNLFQEFIMTLMKLSLNVPSKVLLTNLIFLCVKNIFSMDDCYGHQAFTPYFMVRM